jgi:hypothetical protein
LSVSYSYTASTAFTIAHAREIASRVAADLNLCASYYGSPGRASIADYLEELALMIKGGYVTAYEFGFKRNDQRVVCWRYTVGATGALESDRPGKVQAWVDTTGATHYNFMSYTSKWFDLSETERSKFKATLPIQRGTGTLPSDGLGYWVSDKTYASGGFAATRQSFIPYP